MRKLLHAAVILAVAGGTALAAEKVDKARLPNFAELQVSAEKGNAVAQNNLGVLFATGNGAKLDLKEAAKWYEKAAEQGYAVAQHNLAGLYETGGGVTQDLATAAVWYSLAAEQGDPYAQLSLAQINTNGKFARGNLADAYRWFLIAAKSSEKEVRTAAEAELKKIGPKLTPAAKATAELVAKAWRPNQ